MFHSDMNEEQYEKSVSAITTENMDDKHNSYYHNHREAISHYHELAPCVLSEKNWNTKEDKGKSMIHVLYVLQLAKKQLQVSG